jgi:hypothetical protein
MPRRQDPALEMTGLLSMLFEWYKVTATLPNDKSGAVVEKIKSDYIPPWLRLETFTIKKQYRKFEKNISRKGTA